MYDSWLQPSTGRVWVGGPWSLIHVCELTSNSLGTGCSEGTEFTQLHLRVLMPIVGADASIECYPFGGCGRSKNLLWRTLLSR